jgi:hypothetical protein
MLLTATLVLAFAAATLVASGCGTSSSRTTSGAEPPSASVTTAGSTTIAPALTKAALISKANAICLGVYRKRESTKASTQQQIGAQGTELAAYEKVAATELGKLAPPHQLATDWRLIVGDARRIATNTATISAYAKANNLASPQTNTLMATDSAIEDQLRTKAKEDGFETCALAA